MNKEKIQKYGNRLAIIAIVILAGLAIYMQTRNDKTELVLNSTYDKSFYELVEYVNNMETLLAKAQISNTPEYSAKTLTEIWRAANLAESSLGQIPITHMTLANTLKFINQVGDYSYALSRKTIENNKLSDQDFENLEMLYNKCNELNVVLAQLSSDLSSKSLSWKELVKDDENTLFAQEVSNISKDSFGNIEKGLQDYEGLIYDGPFSEHMTSPTPKGLGSEEYSKEKAEEKIYEYVDKNSIDKIEYIGKVNGTIVAHRFNIYLKTKNNIMIDITELGGHVLWMNYDRDVSHEQIDVQKAKEKALAFLNGHGYNNMKESYYTVENGIATINFAYTQSGVICYTDLIKVKVALDNGDILGMESKGYLNSHTERNIEEVKISLEEARKIINPKMEILSEGLAIVPTDWSTEVLTYEFKGRVQENDFIVYVDANTGKEQDVFIIIDSPNGMLAI